MKMLLLVAAISITLLSCQSTTKPSVTAVKQPNILLIVFEDLSPRIGAYGDPVAQTPVLDALAKDAIVYTNTFTTAPVCAPSRASLITGVHQQTLGAQHMRTAAYGTTDQPAGFEIGYAAVPPPQVKAFPELLRRAGYYTFTGFDGLLASNKKDYQFGEPLGVWDEDDPNASWQNRPRNKPFFGMITLITTHESFLFPTPATSDSPLAVAAAKRNAIYLAGKKNTTNPAAVDVPPWLPDTPLVRQEIARQYDNLAFTEGKLAQILKQLETDGLADNTILIVTTDHGDGFPRAKRHVYDSGLKVPMMIRFPDKTGAGEYRSELISFVDLAPTILALAKTDIPDWIQGRRFLGAKQDSANQYIFAASDRMDNYTDRVKAIRDQRYKLIKNYKTNLPVFQPIAFREQLQSMQEYQRLKSENRLTKVQQSYFELPRTSIELYDIVNDPDEIHNLANNPALAPIRQRLEAALDNWVLRTHDLSAIDEREMVSAMWPGFKQPQTAAPDVSISDDKARLVLREVTEGSSLLWRRAGQNHWNLYTGSISLNFHSPVEAIAQRYGYSPSEIVNVSPENNSPTKMH